VRRYQTGDSEMRAVFPVEALEQVARVIRAHRKPGIGSEVAKKIGARTAFVGASRAQNARFESSKGVGLGSGRAPTGSPGGRLQNPHPERFPCARSHDAWAQMAMAIGFARRAVRDEH